MRYLNSGIFQHEVLEYVKGNNDVQKDVLKELSEKQKVIIEMIIADPFLSAKAISEKMSEKMSDVLTREGGRKEGKWVINNKYQ